MERIMELTRARKILGVNEKMKEHYFVFNNNKWVATATYSPSANQSEADLVKLLKPLFNKLAGQGIVNLNIARLKAKY